MATMNGFDHILNWKLRRGSHQFPGQDGGTCINEAAVVAAGYQHRPINSVEDMPRCFSRPICGFAMHLNDLASDAERQQLLPFVTRLACADSSEVERQRETYIVSRNRGRLAFRQRLEILEGALAIGRQADPLGGDDVKLRMEEVRSKSSTATAMPDTPLSAKIKSWFSSHKEVEPTS
jgi:hypothetical protein